MRLANAGLCALVIIMGLSGCARSPEAREAKYLQKGKAEFARKNYAAAVLHFKNAVSARPTDAEPYYQLGMTYLAGGDLRSAVQYLRKACDLNPKHRDAQLKLAALLSAAGDQAMVEDAQSRARGVLALAPGNVEALNILAAAELRLGRAEDAEAHLQQALRGAPSHLQSYVGLAQTRLARKDLPGAEAALRQAVAQVPKSPDPRLYLGQFYLMLGKTPEAEQQFRQALQLDPKYGPALLALGSLQIRAGQTQQADQTYRQLSALPDRQYRPVHAQFLFESGKRDQAIAEFEKLAAAEPADRNLRTFLVRAYLAANRVADAERVLTAALKKNARDTDALLQRSRIRLASAKYAEAEADVNQVLHYRADSAEAHYLLSKLAQARENAGVRRQELGEVLRLDPSYLAARLELAQLLTATGGSQAALDLLDQTPAGQKNAPAVAVQRNWALMALGRKEEARKGVDQLLAAGKFPEAVLQDAVSKLTQRDFSGARASAEAVLQQTTSDVRPLSVLLQTYTAQNQLAAGVKQVGQYALRPGASPEVQQFYGQLLLQSGDRAGARKAFAAAAAANPNLAVSELSLALLDTDEGKPADARKRLAGLVSSHPAYTPGRMLLAQLDMNEGKPASAIDGYRKVLQLDENNAGALNNLAYLMAESSQPDEALKYAQKAKSLAPQNPAIDDTLGWTYYRKGMYSVALPYLESAAARERTARRQYHLAMAYLKAGDAKRGRQALDQALQLDRSLPEAQSARQMFGIAGQ